MNLYYRKLCYKTRNRQNTNYAADYLTLTTRTKKTRYFRNVSKFAIILGTIYVLTQKLLLAREYAILSKC